MAYLRGYELPGLPASNGINYNGSCHDLAEAEMVPDLRIRTIVSMPFEENTYVIGRADRDDVVVVDPGLQPELILEYLSDEGLAVAAILNTHGHADHIAGNQAIKEAFPDAPIVIGLNDAPMLIKADLNLSAPFDPFGRGFVSPPADRTLGDGDRIEYAGLEFEVREIPGHSPGHIVFVLQREKPYVIGGDVLFRGSVGRTDFPGGSFDKLRSGIHRKLWTLSDDAVVYPGHGPATTIGHEKRTNPFVGDG